MSLGATFGRICRENRLGLDISQRGLASASGISRSYLANIELGTANPTLEAVERLGAALGIEFDLVNRLQARLAEPRQRDFVHARCSVYVDRRLRRSGWSTAREVAIEDGRYRGWVDLVAYHAALATILVIEVKTRIDDVGAIERQLSWYRRSAGDVGRRFGWRAQRVEAWLLVLASDEVDRAIQMNRDLLRQSFPRRAGDMLAIVDGNGRAGAPRGIGLVDPRSRRRAWILKARTDGRRADAPYRNYADAARSLAR